MFDEASQLKLEDNLPALLKGKQIVIAGDEHQMPPSNYFSKIFDGSIEDEDEVEDEEVPVIDRIIFCFPVNPCWISLPSLNSISDTWTSIIAPDILT